MTEQANTGWGLTVSRRFDSEADANRAVETLRQAGFIEGEIRVWQQRPPAVSGGEDAMARVIEGLLAGGVIGGLVGFFLSIAVYWAMDSSVPEERAAISAIVGAAAGAVLTAIAVSVLSRKIAFSHPHHEEAGAGSVVSVTVGDREAQAREAFAKLG